MLRNYIVASSILFFILCENPDNAKTSLIDKNEEAFAKIDKKNNGAFTKEDRRNAFNAGISSIEKTKKSLEKNITYNGYGANSSSKKTSLVKSNIEREKKPKKKSIYSSSAQSNSQIYSAYSTN
tara:strand:+ start:108 stop:479 length:372 start_codon:yes stop_codon:yes gene_type:complete